MTCYHPIEVWQQTKALLDIPPQDYYALKKVSFKETPGRIKIEIPCGHCIGCKLDHANMWATRIAMEAKQWKKCCFVTLTYNNKKLPFSKTGITTLVKKDVQDFLKRLRYYEKGKEQWKHPINGKDEYPIRYFCCGEYGRTGTRAKIGGNPHYHLCIFNWEPEDLVLYKYNKHNQPIFKSKKLMSIWKKGFVTIEELNFETASYAARYVQKKAGIEPHKREYTGEYKHELRIDERNGWFYNHFIKIQKAKDTPQEEEFLLMSRGVGIGRLEWDKNKEKIKRNSGVFIKTLKGIILKQIPRYFKKLWEKEDYEEFYRWKYIKQKESIIKKTEILSKINLPDGTTEEYKWEFYLKQQEKILKDKAKHLKRNEFI